MKIIDLFPWARRNHNHCSELLWKTMVCHKCGHLILSGHLDNKQVINKGILEGTDGCHYEQTLTFGKGCWPEYDLIEATPDGQKHYYIKTATGYKELLMGKSLKEITT